MGIDIKSTLSLIVAVSAQHTEALRRTLETFDPAQQGSVDALHRELQEAQRSLQEQQRHIAEVSKALTTAGEPER